MTQMRVGVGANGFFTLNGQALMEWAARQMWSFTGPTDDIAIEDAPAPDEDTTPESPKSDPVPEDADTPVGTEPAP